MNKPQLSATPGTVNVGTVDVGTVSTPLPVSITNQADVAAPLTVTAAPAGLIAATGCTGSLPARQSCVLQVTGSPTAVGPFQGSVTVAAAGGNTVVIVVQGSGSAQGNFTVAPTAIDLGSLAVGEVVQTAVTVTANANLTLLSTTVRGTEVRIEPTSTCGATLSANQSCTVAVRFTAGAAGASTGNAVVVSQGGVTKTVPITATVLAAAKLVPSPATAGLTARAGETSQTQTVNIGNIGGMATGQLAVAIAPASFKVVSETCSIVTLAAGATCSVVIAYAPAATATANETGTLTVTDRGVGASVATVVLNGVLQTSSTLTLTGGPALGSVAPGALGGEVVFTVTNTSATPSGALTVAVIPPTSITISSNTCATKTTLLQAETCTIGLRLTPAAGALPAEISAVLTVTAANGSVSRSITGAIVTGATLLANPTSVNFGSVFVNQLSAVKTVTITNGGATTTAPLSVNLTGLGAAQVALPGNTCTAALAPGQSCTLTVQYGPTDTTGVNGTIAVTDGVVSASIPMVGTGLSATNFLACKQPVDSETDASCSSFGEVLAAELDMGTQTVGYTTGNAAGAATTDAYTLRVVVAVAATGDSGAITAPLTGTDAADFAITNNKCTAALNPGGNCTMDVTFKPSAAGNRTATLTISGAKGGVWTVALKGKGVALVEIVGAGCADEDGVAFDQDPNSPDYSLAFGQQPLSTQGAVCKYQVIVRGATNPAATTTTTDLALATSNPPDFRNVTVVGTFPTFTSVTEVQANPCDAQVVTLAAGVGRVPQYTCDFYIQFYPQTSKGDKTATVTATASAGGSDVITVTGTATGPLTIGPPSPVKFADISLGTASASNPTDAGTLTVGGLTSGEIKTLTVRNEGVLPQGILGVALAGTNAGDFGIIEDLCTGETLAAMVGTTVAKCTIKVIFAPTSAGAKTATVTATAATGGEAATATLTGTATNPYAVAVAPLTADFSPAPGLVPVPQGKGSAWATFTISNPAAAPRSGKLSYGFSETCTGAVDADENFQLFTATSGAYPAGSCGDSNTAQLDPGATCTFQARFKPNNEEVLSSEPRKSALFVCVGGSKIGSIDLSGLAGPQLTLSGTAITSVDNALTVDFGGVAKATDTSVTFTLTNNADSAVPDVILITPSTGYVVATDSECKNLGTLAAGASCTVKLNVTMPSTQTELLPGTVGFQVQGRVNTLVTINTVASPVAPADLALYGLAEPATLNFGQVPINSTSPNGSGIVTVWFTNKGGLPATGVTGEVTSDVSTEPTAFSLVSESRGTCYSLPGNQLDPGQTCSVRLQFRPLNVTVAAKSATYTLRGGGDSAAVTLVGQAVVNPSPSLWANVVGGFSTVYAFPSTAFGAETGATVYVEFHNPTAGSTGGAVLPTSGDFRVEQGASGAGTACPIAAGAITIAVGACQAKVTFLPATAWSVDTRFRTSVITVGGVPLIGLIGQVQQPAKLQLTATGTATVKVDSLLHAVDFGQVLTTATTMPSLAFTVTNTGEAATAGLVAVKLSTAAQAYLDVGACGTTRLAGTGGGTCPAGSVCSCTATVSVLDGLGLGGYDAAAAITADAAAGTDTAEKADEQFRASVKIVNAARVRIVGPDTTPTTVTFNDTSVGRTDAVRGFVALTVSNGVFGDGSTSSNRQDARGVKVALNDNVNFKLQNVDCPLGLDGTFVLSSDTAESCTYQVQFNPKTAGALTGTVTVTSTVGGTATLTVKGNGLSALVVDAASTADAVRTTVTSTGKVLTITNNGDPAKATGLLRTTLSNKTKFAIVVDSCFGQALFGGQSCTVTVEFTGTAAEAATPLNAEVTVSDGATGTANTVTAYLKSAVPAT